MSTVVLGSNSAMKSSKSRTANLDGTGMPHNYIFNDLSKKLSSADLEVIWTEETFTSKSSFFDNDYLPVANESYTGAFLGKRVSRDVYRMQDGTTIDADLNAAYNIIKKVFPEFRPVVSKGGDSRFTVPGVRGLNELEV